MAEYRTVTTLPSPLAEIVKGALEAEGLTVQLRVDDALGAVYGLQSGVFATRVMVPEAQAASARALIDEIESAEP